MNLSFSFDYILNLSFSFTYILNLSFNFPYMWVNLSFSFPYILNLSFSFDYTVTHGQNERTVAHIANKAAFRKSEDDAFCSLCRDVEPS